MNRQKREYQYMDEPGYTERLPNKKRGLRTKRVKLDPTINPDEPMDTEDDDDEEEDILIDGV